MPRGRVKGEAFGMTRRLRRLELLDPEVVDTAPLRIFASRRPCTSEEIIDSVFERLEELRRDVGEEQSKEIREVQQLVVEIQETVETDEE